MLITVTSLQLNHF